MRCIPLLQVIVIVFLTGCLSLVTVIGNILVLVSFKINKALKTVNNYYLLSLAFADLTIGTLSMISFIFFFFKNLPNGPTINFDWGNLYRHNSHYKSGKMPVVRAAA